MLMILVSISKHSWVILLKNKKLLQLLMLFNDFVKESNWRPNKIWVDKSSESYNR